MGPQESPLGTWESLIQLSRLSDRGRRLSGVWPGSQLRGHLNKPKSQSDPQVHGGACGTTAPTPGPVGQWGSLLGGFFQLPLSGEGRSGTAQDRVAL